MTVKGSGFVERMRERGFCITDLNRTLCLPVRPGVAPPGRGTTESAIRMWGRRFMESLNDIVVAHWDHEPGQNCSADIPVCRIAGFPTCAVLEASKRVRAFERSADRNVGDTAGSKTCATSQRFMESLHPNFLARIGTRNRRVRMGDNPFGVPPSGGISTADTRRFPESFRGTPNASSPMRTQPLIIRDLRVRFVESLNAFSIARRPAGAG